MFSFILILYFVLLHKFSYFVVNNKFLATIIAMDNKFFRFLLAVVCVIAVSMPAAAEVSLSTIREKADRFYQHEEWANALAMFRAILEREPTDMQTYGRSVTVYGAISNPEEQMELLEATQRYALPLDSLFDEVRISAFEIGRPAILEDFMILVKEKQPWLKRNINIRLARLYDSRNNAEKMIEMSDTLLAVNPDDPSMLRIKARGYMLLDRYDEAVAVYKRIIGLNQKDVDAMLNIGVYYFSEFDTRKLAHSSPEADEARKYLGMAYRLNPTEHLRSMLDRLNGGK